MRCSSPQLIVVFLTISLLPSILCHNNNNNNNNGTPNTKLRRYKICNGAKCKAIRSFNPPNFLQEMDSFLYSRWTRWATCTRHCTTKRYRACKFPLICGNTVIHEEAFCYHRGTYCEYIFENNQRDFLASDDDMDYLDPLDEFHSEKKLELPHLSLSDFQNLLIDDDDEPTPITPTKTSSSTHSKSQRKRPRKPATTTEESRRVSQRRFRKKNDTTLIIPTTTTTRRPIIMSTTTSSRNSRGMNTLFESEQFPQQDADYDHLDTEPTCGVARITNKNRNGIAMRILGGQEVQKGRWPWQVAVLNKMNEAFCGGTLISPRWILTAAHCIRKKLLVTVGEHHLHQNDGTERHYQIEAAFIHPDFDHETVDNDIALLLLPQPVPIQAGLATPSSSKTTPSPSASPPIKRKKMESGPSQKGCTILLTGLSKAGKSTISNELTQMLKGSGILVKEFDGKKMRAGLCKELDLAKPHHRSSFVHLVSEHAKGFTEEGFISIISIVAPLSQDRENARLSHQESNLAFLEVYVDRPREECERLSGLLRHVLNIGPSIDANYEPPQSSDIHLKPSGPNVASMCRDIVDTLVANEIISKPFVPLMMLPPLSPMQPTSPSSSSTFDSSAAEADDDDNDYDENVINEKFKLPKKGSALLSIFNYCKGEIIRRRRLQNCFTELKDEDVDKDPMFLIIMNEWKLHYETNVGEERFFPVEIPNPQRKKATPKKGTTTQKKMKQDDFIPLRFDGATLKYGNIVGRQTQPTNLKCLQCWRLASSCPTHSATKQLHFAVLMDGHEASKTYIALQQRRNEKQEWTDEVVKTSGRLMGSGTLLSYLQSHPNYKFTEVYAKSILYSSPDKLPIFHTAKISTALICLFRNMERVENDAMIQPHTLLHNRIDMFSTNLEVLERTLAENGINFTAGDDEAEQPSTSPLVTNFCWKLPSVYMGTRGDDKINIGLKVSMIGGDTHSATHDQRGETFTSGTLYQTPLTPEQLELGNSINTSLHQQDNWPPQQKALFKLVEDDCRRKEAFGITTLIIAEMKGQSRNGILIQRDNKKYEHINTAEVGDLEYIQNLFKFLTGHSLEVTVAHSNDLSFDDAFFE